MSEIKIIGKINLDEYLRERRLPVRDGGMFKLLNIRCSFYDHEPITFSFGEPLDEQQSKGGYFSLLLGKNGVCKSSLLRELIEFFIDARGYSKRKKKSHVSVESVEYVINESVYQIDCVKNKYTYLINGITCARESMEFPLVIASTMGMFDKFPVNSKVSYSNGRYKQEFYRYVGPKANSNMFTSKANVLLQQMSALPTVKNANQVEMLKIILSFIGYDPLIVFQFQTREPYTNQKTNSIGQIGGETLEFYNQINDGQPHSLDFSFKRGNLRELKSTPISALYELRQNGMLKGLKCLLFKNGKEVDSDYLSSGEFNLLSIVMSVVLAAGAQHLLVLLDEPEISQHPNWQLDLIPNLEKALVDFNCHFLIATHCHFLVSNLPTGRSNVICMTRTPEDVIMTKSIPSETYGWSAEEVLLEAFGVPTDRNRYLAKSVSDFMRGISQQTIEREDVESQLDFFRKTTLHLNSVDPMKKILDTIINEFG